MSRLLNLPALGATLALLAASLLGAAAPATALPAAAQAAEGNRQSSQKCPTIKVSTGATRAAAQAIGAKHALNGGSVGVLGCAKAAPRQVRGGGFSQEFQGGAIYWAPTYGARLIHGPVRKAWAAAGGEGGKLGVPMGDQIAVPGFVSQPFDGGQVAVSKSGKVVVTYNGPASIIGRGAVTQPLPLLFR